jgi:protein SCO1/2
MKNKILNFSSLFIILFTIVSCRNDKFTLPYFNTAEFTPEWIDAQNLSSTKMHVIDDFSFIDQSGHTITNEDFKGKIYIANFFFTTCPGICPQMTANMAKLQDIYKDDSRIKFLSHSVTPWIDTVEQLQRYAREYEVIPEKWHLVTGDKSEIYNIARQSYFAEMEIGTQLTADDFLHTENFILVDTNKHIRGIYNGTIISEIERIRDDISVLLYSGN